MSNSHERRTSEAGGAVARRRRPDRGSPRVVMDSSTIPAAGPSEIDSVPSWADLIVDAECRSALSAAASVLKEWASRRPPATRARRVSDGGYGRVTRRPPALHLRGPHGTGKRLAARIMAAELGLGLVSTRIELDAPSAGVDSLLKRVARDVGPESLLVVHGVRSGMAGQVMAAMAGRSAPLVVLSRPVAVPDPQESRRGAVGRTFDAVVDLAVPGSTEREEIWRRSFPPDVWFDQGTDLPSLLSRLEVTGGNIVNTVAITCAEARARGSLAVTLQDTLLALQREVERDGRVFLHLLSGRAAAPT